MTNIGLDDLITTSSFVIDELKRIYTNEILPLEKAYLFHDFHSPELTDPDFEAKPMILLVGQCSSGKTTFIRYLLGKDFPGMRIGPEPTTDKFIAVMHGKTENITPGNAVMADKTKQFRSLSTFGNAFFNRFECVTVDSPVLKAYTIIDSPGILSGEQQMTNRGYDFIGVLKWFAERVDRILVLFDANKLDLSDEFTRSLNALKGHDDKIRIILNKADIIDHQELMRVYGALLWSLGKVLNTPEVVRVYVGSFWDEPLQYETNQELFEAEKRDLLRDLQSLRRNGTIRKLSDLLKRARLAKVHAYIISELRRGFPLFFGKENRKMELIESLDEIYKKIQQNYRISPGDFPDIDKMKELLEDRDFRKFQRFSQRLIDDVDRVLAEDVAELMQRIPQDPAITPLVTKPVDSVGSPFEEVSSISPSDYLVDKESEEDSLSQLVDEEETDQMENNKVKGAPIGVLFRIALVVVVLALVWNFLFD